MGCKAVFWAIWGIVAMVVVVLGSAWGVVGGLCVVVALTIPCWKHYTWDQTRLAKMESGFQRFQKLYGRLVEEGGSFDIRGIDRHRELLGYVREWFARYLLDLAKRKL
jgi:uncharacterized membrane protein (DUF106 family)